MPPYKLPPPSEDKDQENIVYILRTDPKYRFLLPYWTFDSTGDLNTVGMVIAVLRKFIRFAIPAKTINIVAGIVGKKIGANAKKLGRRTSQPDFVLSGLFVYKGSDRPLDEMYRAGLQIELKKSEFKLFKKNGDLYKNDHVEKQYNGILKLRVANIEAEFAPGFDAFFEIFDKFLNDYRLAE